MHFRSLVFNASTLTLCALLLSACSGDDKGLSVLFTCGNGQVESGEQCDPGGICDDGSRCIVGGVSTCPTRACLPADTAICSSICTRPECGDGLAQGGLEQCDGFDLRGATCNDFGRGPNPEGGPDDGLLCSDSCTLDSTGCGPIHTPTPPPSATPSSTDTPATEPPTATTTNTPEPTATALPACNLPVLEPGEFYADPDLGIVGTLGGTECPEDAQILACTPTADRLPYEVVFTGPAGFKPTSATMLVGYRSDQLDIGSRDREAVQDIGPGSTIFTNRDLDYAIRLVWVGTSSLDDRSGVPLVLLNFALCDGTVLPDIDSVACTIEGCSGAGGPIAGCSCELRIFDDVAD